MSRPGLRSILTCAAIAIVCFAILLSNQSPMLDLAAAAPFVFYLPGWALLHALRAEPDGWLETGLLRTVLSLAIVVILGLALHRADAIDRAGWIAALGGVTGLGCLASMVVDLRGRTTNALATKQPSGMLPSLGPTALAMTLAAVILAGGAVAFSRAIVSGYHEFLYTRLWILPDNNAPEQVVIGLLNEEGHDESYVLEVRVDRRLEGSWNNLSLKAGETWTTSIRWVGLGDYSGDHGSPKGSTSATTTASSAPPAGAAQTVGPRSNPRIEAFLYRANDRSEVYRYVWIASQCTNSDDLRGRSPCES